MMARAREWLSVSRRMTMGCLCRGVPVISRGRAMA